MNNPSYQITQPTALDAVSDSVNHAVNNVTNEGTVVYPDFGKKPSSLAKAADKLDEINDVLEQTAADLLAQVSIILAVSNNAAETQLKTG